MRPSAPLLALLPAGLLAAGLLLTGCGAPPDLPEDPTAVSPPGLPAGTGPTATAPGSPPPGLPEGTFDPDAGFPEEIALACDGRPGESELLAVLHADGILAATDEATVTEGPFCAGTWQYAVISVPDRDPLQVVTRGEPEALELVTAGTDVCSVEVRFQAPPGIQGAAAC